MFSMDQKWLEEQKEQISLALAQQGIRLVVPVSGASRMGGAAGKEQTLASFIDHTLLKPTASKAQIEQLCQEARQYQFASVCVNPVHVEAAARLLQGSDVKVCTVIGFPLGANSTLAKVLEARMRLLLGQMNWIWCSISAACWRETTQRCIPISRRCGMRFPAGC